MEIAAANLVAGTVAAAVLAGLGAYMRWFNPTGLYGLSEVLGLYVFAGAGLLLCVSVVAHFWRRLTGVERERRLEATRTPEAVAKLSWAEFEQLVADLLRRQGYKVVETGGTADGGVDLVASKDGLDHLVQCKQYKVWSVGEPKVREFFGAMAAHKTRCHGMFVTCGRFTEPARAFAKDKPLRLIDGEELMAMLDRVNPLYPAADPVPSTSASVPAPVCPMCGAAMVRRVASKGANAGQPFWGCSQYPKCRQIVPV